MDAVKKYMKTIVENRRRSSLLFQAWEAVSNRLDDLENRMKAVALVTLDNEKRRIEALGKPIAQEQGGDDYIDIVFDGPPSHESGRFVEVEDSNGASMIYGEWIDRGDGYWVLRIADLRARLAASEQEAKDYYNVLKGAQGRLALLESENAEFAKGIVAMTKSLDYIKGICDRGGYEGTDKEEEYVDLRILGYVKKLEAENARLNCDINRMWSPEADLRARLERAERSLRMMGATDEGGELWKPPLGKAPVFIRETVSVPLEMSPTAKEAKKKFDALGYSCIKCGNRFIDPSKACPYCGGRRFDAIVPEARTDLEKFKDAISPEEHGLLDALKSGNFITCGAMSEFGATAAKIVEEALSERYFARLRRDEALAEVKRLSVMIRAIRDEATLQNAAENCDTEGCPDPGFEKRGGRRLCRRCADRFDDIKADAEKTSREEEAKAEDYDRREKENAELKRQIQAGLTAQKSEVKS